MSEPSLTYGPAFRPVDALFISPHPDDVELFAGGLAVKMSRLGHSIGILDLTQGELGSLGTPELRAQEAAAAAAVLGARWRGQLGAPDGGLSSQEGVLKPFLESIVRTLRIVQPLLVVCPYWEDRHPDHTGAAKLVTDAVFFANLRNFLSEAGAPHEVERILYYPTRVLASPSFVVDVSEDYAVKEKAILCYESQMPKSGSTPTAPGGEARLPVPLVSSSLSLTSLMARDAAAGALIGTKYGEAYVLRTAVPIADPVLHFRSHHQQTPLFYLR